MAASWCSNPNSTYSSRKINGFVRRRCPSPIEICGRFCLAAGESLFKLLPMPKPSLMRASLLVLVSLWYFFPGPAWAANSEPDLQNGVVRRWRPVPDEIFLQEVGQQIKTDR